FAAGISASQSKPFVARTQACCGESCVCIRCSACNHPVRSRGLHASSTHGVAFETTPPPHFARPLLVRGGETTPPRRYAPPLLLRGGERQFPLLARRGGTRGSEDGVVWIPRTVTAIDPRAPQ